MTATGQALDPLLPLTGVGAAALVVLVIEDPLSAAAAMTVLLGAGLFAWARTQDLYQTAAASSLSIVLLPADAGAILLLAALLFLLYLHHLTQVPYLLALAAPAFLLPTPAGPWVAAVALTFLVGAPVVRPHDRSPPGGPLLLGLLLLAGGLVFAPLAAVVALVVGVTARVVVQHPGRVRLAATLGRSGTWGATVPAGLLLFFAALDRIPVLAPFSLLQVGWASIGIGVLFAFVLLGIEIGLRSAGVAPFHALVLPTAGLGVAGAAVVSGELRVGAHLAGLAWALAAPYAALGVKRVGAAFGHGGLVIGIVATAAGLLAIAVRALY